MLRFFISWQLWISLLIIAAVLGFLVWSVDWGEFAHALATANYWYVAPAAAIYFVGQWFRALRWQYLLSPIDHIPAKRLYPVIMVGYTANNVLPARVGELIRAVYLSRREKAVRVPTSIAVLSVERTYDGLVLLATGMVAALVLWVTGQFDRSGSVYQSVAAVLMLGSVVGFATLLTVLTLLAVNQRAAGWLITLTAILPPRFHRAAEDIVRNFVEGLSSLASPRKHAVLVVSSIPIWVAEVAIHLILVYSFGLQDSFGSFWLLLAAISLVTVTASLITAIPASVGGIGPFEVVAQQTLVAVGVGAAVAAVYAIMVHLVMILPVVVVGLAILFWHNVPLRQLNTLSEADVSATKEAA